MTFTSHLPCLNNVFRFLPYEPGHGPCIVHELFTIGSTNDEQLT